MFPPGGARMPRCGASRENGSPQSPLLPARCARPCWSRPPARVGLCTQSKIAGFARSALSTLQSRLHLTVLPEACRFWSCSARPYACSDRPGSTPDPLSQPHGSLLPGQTVPGPPGVALKSGSIDLPPHASTSGPARLHRPGAGFSGSYRSTAIHRGPSGEGCASWTDTDSPSQVCCLS